MKMWQQTNVQWTSYNLMLFGIILLLGFFGIIGDTNAIRLQEINPSSTQPVTPANLSNLKNKLERFHATYNATLLNSTLLPFLMDCNEMFNKTPEKMSYTDRLCITYYDMINSIYHLNEFKNGDSVTNLLEKYNGKSMTDNFCIEFPGEITARLEKQPFAESANITNWLTLNDCVVSCLVKDNNTIYTWRILDICKLISGGLSMIVNKSKVIEITSPKETSTSTNNSSSNKMDMVNDQKIKHFTNEVQTNDDDKQPMEPIAADGEDSEPNNDTKIDLTELKNDDPAGNDDTADEAENHNEDGQHETPLEISSNNSQSPLSANIKEFREDNESSFFSYFMFLSFLVITFYVAYHNKSKILALLIEGRRGRTFSARGSSRRKSHSGEYRKLDCNLEEAIQSGGSKTLSTQIIY